MRRDHAAPVAHEGRELIALLSAQRGNVWQDQCFELLNVRRIQKPVVHHFKRNPRLNQRLVAAINVVLHFAAVKPRRLL